MRPTFKSLRLLVNNPGPHNDSADILSRMPSLERLARTSTKNSIKALKAGQNETEFLRPYAPDIAAWLTHFAQVPAYYDANGHYARVLPIFNGFSFDQGANQLNSLSPAERRTAQLRGGNRFCPGAATQPATDGSNPFTDDGRLTADDCVPSAEAGGPVRTAHEAADPDRAGRGRRAGRARGRRGRRRRRGGDYKVRAIFDSAAFAIPGQDVMVAGAKVGSVDELAVTDDKRAAVILKIDEPAFQDFREDAECQIRLQSVIGEKLVECVPTQPRPEGDPAPPRCARSRTARTAPASTCCRWRTPSPRSART